MESTFDEVGSKYLCNGQPKYATYEDYQHRLDSFKPYWPQQMVQTPKAMANAGFYYTKQGDSVVCFSCGILLREWESYDSPWVEHVLHQTKPCDFVRNFCPENVKVKYQWHPALRSVEESTQTCQHDAPGCLRMLQDSAGFIFCTTCGHLCGKRAVDTI